MLGDLHTVLSSPDHRPHGLGDQMKPRKRQLSYGLFSQETTSFPGQFTLSLLAALMERLLYAFLTVASILAPLRDWGQRH